MTQFHPPNVTRTTFVALWLQLIAIVGTAFVSAYLIYAASVISRQAASIGEAIPATVYYLFGGGILLFLFSVWRLVRAISCLRQFRSQYRAHTEATRQT